jgi:hypothetical protein
MAEHSKERVQANAAFLKTQNQSIARERIASESDLADRARDAKTAKLKGQRLDKEAHDQAAIAAAPPKSKSRGSSKAK